MTYLNKITIYSNKEIGTIINNMIDDNQSTVDKINENYPLIKSLSQKIKIGIYIKEINDKVDNINLLEEQFNEYLEDYKLVVCNVLYINKVILKTIYQIINENKKVDSCLSNCTYKPNGIIDCIINKLMILRNNKRILVLVNKTSQDVVDVIEWMIENSILLKMIDIVVYDRTKTTALKELKKCVSLGYKFIIGAQTSNELLECVEFLRTHENYVLYFNSLSTAPFYDGPKLPLNIVRTALDDYELCDVLFSSFLNSRKLYDRLLLGNYDELAEKLEISSFTKICYIYQESIYTNDFLTSLELVDNIQEKPLELIKYKIEENSFPDELKELLIENPVSNDNYKFTKKTLFIVNSSTPQQLLDMFDKQEYTDNFFAFGDPFFDTSYRTDLNWAFSFTLQGNFSMVGYKYSKFTDPRQNVSPMDLGIIDILFYTSMNYFYKNNLSVIKLLKYFYNVEILKYSEIADKYKWFIAQEFWFYMSENLEDDKTFNYTPVFSSEKFNPRYDAIMERPRSYSNLATEIEFSQVSLEQFVLLRRLNEYSFKCPRLDIQWSLYKKQTEEATSINQIRTLDFESRQTFNSC